MYEYIQNSRELPKHLLMRVSSKLCCKADCTVWIRSANVIKPRESRCSFLVLENVQGTPILTKSTSIIRIKITLNLVFLLIKYTKSLRIAQSNQALVSFLQTSIKAEYNNTLWKYKLDLYCNAINLIIHLKKWII